MPLHLQIADTFERFYNVNAWVSSMVFALMSETCQNERERKLSHVANRSLDVANVVQPAHDVVRLRNPLPRSVVGAHFDMHTEKIAQPARLNLIYSSSGTDNHIQVDLGAVFSSAPEFGKKTFTLPSFWANHS